MNLPRVENPDRYAGLYVVDFGDTAAVGYTADEVAMLLESERYAQAKVYRIHGADPAGRLELLAVPRQRFLLEAGLLFHDRDLETARGSYEFLRRLAQTDKLPCRAQLFLAGVDEPVRLPWVVGLAYPAESDQDVSRWMLDHHVAIGAYADGGISCLDALRARSHVIESCQLISAGRQSRSREEVLAAVGRPVQRVA